MKLHQIYKYIFFLIFNLLIFSNANAIAADLHGWAWSSNIGWISMNSSDSGAGGGPYSVVVDTITGNMTGYAWSSNIGWIKFGGLSSFPSGGYSATNANVNISTGEVKGWIRACAGTADGQCGDMNNNINGWDGWIELSGTNHSSLTTDGTGGVTFIPATGDFVGYAWGGDVIGWIQFNVGISGSGIVVNCSTCSSAGSISCNLDIAPQSISSGQTVDITWDSTNATSCNVANGVGDTIGSTINDADGSAQENPTTSRTYQLTCQDSSVPVNQCLKDKSLTVSAAPDLPLWLNNTEGLESIRVRPRQEFGLNWRGNDLAGFIENTCVGTVYDSGNNPIPFPAWDTVIPLDNDRNNGNPFPLTINDKGEYQFMISCKTGDPSDPVTINSNEVKINVNQAKLKEI